LADSFHNQRTLAYPRELIKSLVDEPSGPGGAVRDS
jgi:hypothetical protein